MHSLHFLPSVGSHVLQLSASQLHLLFVNLKLVTQVKHLSELEQVAHVEGHAEQLPLL